MVSYGDTVSSFEEETYSTVFASLRHPIRRKILRALSSGPQSFSDLMRTLGIESSHLNYHLEGLASLLAKTELGEYTLSSLGRIAVSTMKQVEEPPSPPFRIQSWHGFWRRERARALALGTICIILAAGLVGVFAYHVSVANDKNSTISLLNSQAAALRSQIQSDESRINSLNSQNAELQTQLASNNYIGAANNVTIANLQTQITNLQNQFKNLQKQITELSNNGAGAKMGPVYIRADGSIDPSTAPILTVDNVIYNLTGDILSDSDGIVVEKSNVIIDGAGYTLQGDENPIGTSGFDLNNVNNVTIKNANVEGFSYCGISLDSSSLDTIFGNNITNNGCGINILKSSNNNTVFANTENNNSAYGIEIEWSSGNFVYGNNVTNNACNGVELYNSSYNVVSANNLTNNSWDGIDLFLSSFHVVCQNNISQNGNNGIVLIHSSNNNTVVANNVTDNGYGLPDNVTHIATNYAICVMESSYDSIFGNDFVANARQANDQEVYIMGTSPSGIPMLPMTGNSWDDGYPSGGNYWGDYKGPDLYSGPGQNVTGSDGIGDTPYGIDSNNTDHFPLMAPVETFNAKWNITSCWGNSSIGGPSPYSWGSHYPTLGAPVYISVEPVAVSPLINVNASVNGLEVPSSQFAVGQNFTVDIHLRNATATNVPASVTGVEVHFDFSNILNYCKPIGFTSMIGQPGGVLAGSDVNYALNGFYDRNGIHVDPPGYYQATQYVVAVVGVASPNSSSKWNNDDGLVAQITFQLTGQPSKALNQSDFYSQLHITYAELCDSNANYIPYSVVQGTLKIDDPNTIPGDLNNDGKVGLDDLVILTKAYGSKPGDQNWNPNADIKGNGKVDLADLTILATHYGQHM